jgi:hypothetical protein
VRLPEIVPWLACAGIAVAAVVGSIVISG